MNRIAIAGNGYEEGLRDGREVVGKWQPEATTRLEKWRQVVIEAPTSLNNSQRSGSSLVRMVVFPYVRDGIKNQPFERRLPRWKVRKRC